MDAEVLAVRNEVLAWMPLSLRTTIVRLPRRFAKDFHLAVDFGDHGRILRFAGLEDFGHARQTAGDVLRTGHFARRLGQQPSGGDLFPSMTSMWAFSGR